MSSVRVRLPCPICLGTRLTRVKVDATGALVLEHCVRCGGVWFPHGGVERLRRAGPEALWQAIAARPGTPRRGCRGCGMRLARGADRCPACGWSNRIECPACQAPMVVGTVGTTRLDSCRRCLGTWFDHAELNAIWEAECRRALHRLGPAPGKGAKTVEGARGVAEVLAWEPGLAPALAHLAAGADGQVGEVLAATAGTPEGMAAAIAEAAASTFETLVGIIGDALS